jgi:G protein-coupled receptor 157
MDESDEVCPKHINCTSRPGKESFDIGLLPTYLSLSSSSLSCLGSLLILLAYVVLKDMRTGAQKVITLLAIADFFTAFGYIIGGVNYLQHFGGTNAASCKRFNTICEIQSFITTWSSMCSFWWTSILAFYFFLVLVFNRSSLAAKLVPVYNVLAWLGPLTIVLPLLLTDNLGYAPYVASNWCYIKDKDYATQSLGHSRKVTALLFVGGKLWEIMTYVWISVLYIMIRIKVSSQPQRAKTINIAGRVDVRLLAIPILFIVCRMWGTLQFFFSLSVSSQIHHGCVTSAIHWAFRLFGYFQAVGDGAQGWCNAILYIFLSPTIRRRLIVDPCNQCINTTIDRAAVLLETDTRSHTAGHSEQSLERTNLIEKRKNTERQNRHNGAKNLRFKDAGAKRGGHYGATDGSSDTTYHSFSADDNSDSSHSERAPLRRHGAEEQSRNVQSRTVTSKVKAAEQVGFRETGRGTVADLYDSQTERSSHFSTVSHSPETRDLR